jgi:hypothetical protein
MEQINKISSSHLYLLIGAKPSSRLLVSDGLLLLCLTACSSTSRRAASSLGAQRWRLPPPVPPDEAFLILLERSQPAGYSPAMTSISRRDASSCAS